MVEEPSPSLADINRRSRVDQLRAFLIKVHLIGAARFVDRIVRRLFFAGVKFLRSVARVPVIGSLIDPILNRVDRHDRLHFEISEVLRVCGALNDVGLPYWLAGGWGLDALIGSETRRHHDLDFVLYPFHENLSKVALMLENLGYSRMPPLGGTLWFPDAEVFEDDAGHHVEVLNINWRLISSVEALIGPTTSPLGPPVQPSKQATPHMLERCTSHGGLNGLSLPALSVVAQELFHLGYPRRPEEPHAEDVMRLISLNQDEWVNPLTMLSGQSSARGAHEASTLLLVPIFSFPADLWRLCRLYHNDLLIPPHVTLAIPFKPLESVTSEVIKLLTEFFEEIHEFDFNLENVRWFGTDVVYLEPSNADMFRSIVARLQVSFPDFRPYDGAFESVIPHVTLSEHGSLADRRILARHAPKFTPISAHASHVWLMSDARGRDDWSIVKIFRLGEDPLVRTSDSPKPHSN